MKTQLLIALTCPSVAFADRGNDFSNSLSSVLKGNDFPNGKSRTNKANDFSNGTFGSGGYTFQSLPEWLSEYG